MEKRISFVQFQSVKSVAKAIDPIIRQKNRVQAQLDSLDAEYENKLAQAVARAKERLANEKLAEKERLETELSDKNSQIDAIEAGIVSIIGFRATDLVKKVIEPNEKGAKETKYLPTDIVSYDNVTKEYVITTPDTTTATEDIVGSDHDKDKEAVEQQIAEEALERETAEKDAVSDDNLPW